MQAADASSDNEIAILTVGSAFLGVLVAVLLTEVLAARRRRREGRATLVSLLAQLTAAIAGIQSLRVGIGSPERVSQQLEFAIVRERIVELENRLSIDEIARISKWLFQASTAFDDYVRLGESGSPGFLEIATEFLERAHRLIRIEGVLSEPFGWLRHPQRTRALRKARNDLLKEDLDEAREAAAKLGLPLDSGTE
ncbi:MAG: hypothetical protein F4X25_00110 [Chloroflexi bacterium]|nr:hypothetical protein [Chloroflexota bacterium]